MEPPCFGGINVTHAVQGGLAEQGVDEGGRFERRQIVGAFPESDQLHRHPEFLLDAENDAALGRSIELGQHHTGDVHYIGEYPGLRQTVLPGARSGCTDPDVCVRALVRADCVTWVFAF